MALKNLDTRLLMEELCKALDRLAVIYQIPNYDPKVNSILLAEWILENYQHHDLALVQEALRNPPRLSETNDHTWRLTPDSISGWIDYTRIKRANQREVEESRKRQEEAQPKHQYSPETEKMIADFQNKLLEGVQKVPALTEKEIKENGQLRPKAVKYNGTDKEYLILKELQRQYFIDCYDKYTGKPNENWMSFEEWRML